VSQSDKPGNDPGISRRDVLQRGGIVTVAVALAGVLPRVAEQATQPAAYPYEGEAWDIVRAEDQLMLRLFYHAELFEIVQLNGFGLGIRPIDNKARVIRITMPSQHVMEWYNQGRPSKPVHARHTEVHLSVPAGHVVKLTTAGILTALRDLPLRTPSVTGTVGLLDVPTVHSEHIPTATLARAAIDPAPEGRQRASDDARQRGAAVMAPEAVSAEAPPEDDDGDDAVVNPADVVDPDVFRTELTVSSRLVIAPPGGETRFTHATGPVTHGTPWHDQWSTRLTVRTQDGGRAETTLPMRATRAHDAENLDSQHPWALDTDPGKLSALSAGDAAAIVDQNRVRPPANPDIYALKTDHLHLSPRLGATTRMRGKWKPSADVGTFQHRTNSSRDVFHRITTPGVLYPLGHAAERTVTTERVFSSDGVNGGPAVLVKTVMITVQQNRQDYNSRTWPFRSVQILIDQAPPGSSESVAGSAGYLVIDQAPFLYPCVGIDHSGKPVRFSMPLVFVPDSFTDFATLATNYSAKVDPNENTRIARVPLGHVTVAEPGESPGATEVIGAADLAASASGAFIPRVDKYVGRLPALGHLGDQASTMDIVYAGAYVDSGFAAANKAQVALELPAALPVAVTEAAASAGLLGPMALRASGTSRTLGVVAGTFATIAGGTFNPAEYLGNLLSDLTLFGAFPVGQLIAASTDLSRAPKLLAATVDGMRTHRFSWATPMFTGSAEVGSAGAMLRRIPDTTPMLTVTAELSVGADDQPHQQTVCEITDVLLAIGLAGTELIRIPVRRIRFASVDAQKPVVTVQLGEIEFLGVLGFVNRLAQLIGGDGFGGNRAPAPAGAAPAAGSAAGAAGTGGADSGPALDVTADGVRASYALAVPAVAVGMFSLENISFGASLDLPFTASPRFAFNFATFDNPFRLVVSALGGSGFLGLAMSAAKGLEMVEGSLEFGAQISINLGVVKGKVSAFGGVYFKIEDGSSTLTGYLSIEGEVSVLSIVTLGVALTLSLTYHNGKVTGTAEMVFHVSTFFFSATVRRDFTRTFAGSNGDPTFAQLMAPDNWTGARPWDTYCQAYA
jgi:hypothetical protein